jgi:hypothetical protein
VPRVPHLNSSLFFLFLSFSPVFLPHPRIPLSSSFSFSSPSSLFSFLLHARPESLYFSFFSSFRLPPLFTHRHTHTHSRVRERLDPLANSGGLSMGQSWFVAGGRSRRHRETKEDPISSGSSRSAFFQQNQGLIPVVWRGKTSGGS